MRTVIKDNAIFSKAHEEYKRFVQDDEMTTLYEARLRGQLDYDSGMAAAKEKGEKVGIEKGIEKEKIEISQQMILNGMADATIRKITGLSKEKIKELRRKIR